MAWKVPPAKWLQESADLAEGIVLSPHRIKTEWTAASFRAELDRIGLSFTNGELTQIAAELVTRGVLVVV